MGRPADTRTPHNVSSTRRKVRSHAQIPRAQREGEPPRRRDIHVRVLHARALDRHAALCEGGDEAADLAEPRRAVRRPDQPLVQVRTVRVQRHGDRGDPRLAPRVLIAERHGARPHQPLRNLGADEPARDDAHRQPVAPHPQQLHGLDQRLERQQRLSVAGKGDPSVIFTHSTRRGGARGVHLVHHRREFRRSGLRVGVEPLKAAVGRQRKPGPTAGEQRGGSNVARAGLQVEGVVKHVRHARAEGWTLPEERGADHEGLLQPHM
mmetsp:Transcript_18308/g.60369  ORF Transcript_18308/g.60369 Transcript_18308/m.60369 type:complete len:265 (+) Transcript_18308:62-856(+)